MFGYQIISTGGTYRELQANNMKLQKFRNYRFYRAFAWKSKIPSPQIHAGILASRSREDEVKELSENDIDLIDMVVVTSIL